MRKMLVVMISLIALTAFKWVKLTPEGEKIRVLAASEVTSCKKLGSTTSSVKDNVGPFDRKATKVARELEYLARNSAASEFKEKGADTVVPLGEIEDGKRKFEVYKCVNP